MGVKRGLLIPVTELDPLRASLQETQKSTASCTSRTYAGLTFPTAGTIKLAALPGVFFSIDALLV